MKSLWLKRSVVVVLVLSMCLVLFGCNKPAEQSKPANESKSAEQSKPADDKKVYTIKAGLGQPTSHTYYKGLDKFKQIVESGSNGRIKMEIYPDSQLGGEREMQESVALGNLEMTVSGLLSIYEPLFSMLDMPYIFRDRDHIKKFHQSQVFADLCKPLESKNIKVLTYFEGGFRQVTNNKKPINTVEDLKGLKMRVPEIAGIIETFKQLGAVVTPMASKELYGALQQGVVDGQENPFQNIYSNKFYEVQKYLAITNHTYNSGYVYISNKFYQSLPDDLKQLVLKAAKEANDYQVGLCVEGDKTLLDQLKAKGMQVTTPDQEAFRKTATPVYDIFIQKIGDKAKKLVEDIKAVK